MRTLASFEGYLASSTGTSVQLHQYVPGRIADPRTGLTLDVDTDYPWQGTVRLRVVQAPGSEVELAVRVPAWATGSTLDGEPVAAGYGVVRRTWAVGDTLTLELPMEPRLTVADHRVDAVRGCVAIERGPLVYALEQVDQPDGVPVDDVLIDPSTTFVVEHDDDLLGGATVIKVAGLLAASPHDTRSPYRGASAPGDARDRVRDVELTAIPYHLWANRGPQPMRVWIPTA